MQFEKKTPWGVMREKRARKKEAKEKGIDNRGGIEKEFEQILEEDVNPFLKQKEEEYCDWIEQKFEDLREYFETAGISKEQVIEEFEKGFKTFVKQEYRLFKLEDPIGVRDEFTDQYFNELIFVYVVDFILSLRRSQRLNISSRIAIAIARKSYHYNPDLIVDLQTKFPDLDVFVILYAAVHNPRKPEKFLRVLRERIPKLQEQFPDSTFYAIQYVLVHNPRRPEKFLRALQERFFQLQKQFPDLPASVIQRVAIYNPRNPKKFLLVLRDKILNLREQFPDLPASVIQYAAVHNPKDSERLLKRYKEGKIKIIGMRTKIS